MTAALAVTGAVVLLAAGCGGKPFPAGVSDLRVCDAASFDSDAKQCEADETGRTLVSSRFYCTARVGKREGSPFVFRFLRNGKPVSAQRGAVPSGKWTVAFSVTAGGLLGNRALIGGRWSCDLRVGTAPPLRAAFVSGGPTAVVLHLAVCPTAETKLAGHARICATATRGLLRHVSSVTCSATLVAARGHVVEVQLVYRGRQTLTRRRLSSKVRIESLLQPVGVRFFARSGRLPTGPYVCRFGLGARTLASHDFRVAR